MTHLASVACLCTRLQVFGAGPYEVGFNQSKQGIKMKKILNKKLQQGSLVLGVSLLCFSQAAVSAIVYTNDNRSVEVSGSNGTGGYNDLYTPDSPYADFNVTAQNSSLSGTGFSASGSGYAYSDYDWSSTVSVFDISFSLTTESIISLNGSLYGYDEYYGSGDASVTLYNGTNIVFSDSVSATYGETLDRLFFFNDVLAAGDYQLIAQANPYFEIAQSSYSLSAVITPSAVPVPAAIWLFVSGFAGLLAFARKKQ